MSHQLIGSFIRNKPVISLNLDNSIQDAAVLMTAHRLDAIPVIDEGRLIGICTEWDLISRVISARLHHQIPVAYVMTRDLYTISPDHSLMDALDLMVEQDLNYLLVATQEKVIGILSLREILRESRGLWNSKETRNNICKSERP